MITNCARLAIFSLSCAAVWALGGATNDNNRTVIAIDWKFDHILILPVGCSWAGDVVWRVEMRCPVGHFYVPTRLQASANHSRYCSSSRLFSNANMAFEKANQFPYLKQVRQLSSSEYGDGQLNRYDYPYFPIYSHANSYWNCVGTNAGQKPDGNLKSCSFLVRASDYAGKPASHRSSSTNQIATLVLPGPYCSTVDSYEHVDRSGGVVYKASFVRRDNSSTPTWKSHVSKFVFENQAAIREAVASPPSEIKYETGEVVDIGLPGGDSPPPDFNLHQSENVHLAVRGESASGLLKLKRCQISLQPRNPAMALALWQTNPSDFERSLLANIHVSFIQIIPEATRHSNYSVFYDDVTALQQGATLEGLFRVNMDVVSGVVHLSINFDAERVSGGARDAVRIGEALFEFLIVGDQQSDLLQSMWPYRYATPYSRHLLTLLRNANDVRCEMKPGSDIGLDDVNSSAEEIDGDQAESNPAQSGRNAASGSNKSCWWCPWLLWVSLGGLIIGMIAASFAVLYLCTR